MSQVKLPCPQESSFKTQYNNWLKQLVTCTSTTTEAIWCICFMWLNITFNDNDNDDQCQHNDRVGQSEVGNKNLLAIGQPCFFPCLNHEACTKVWIFLHLPGSALAWTWQKVQNWCRCRVVPGVTAWYGNFIGTYIDIAVDLWIDRGMCMS